MYNPLIGKVKVLIAQSSPTLCDPMDCSPPGSSAHGLLPWTGKNTGVGCRSFLLQVIFPIQGSKILHCRKILYRLSHQRSPSYRKREVDNCQQGDLPQLVRPIMVLQAVLPAGWRQHIESLFSTFLETKFHRCKPSRKW